MLASSGVVDNHVMVTMLVSSAVDAHVMVSMLSSSVVDDHEWLVCWPLVW
jgi:hypothetical protein